jgi:hypothetical protein
MRRRAIPLSTVLSLSVLALAATPLSAQVQVGASISEEGLESFYLGIGDYFRAPTVQIRAVRQTLPPDEAPVVFFLAQRAHVEPGVILRLRRDGRSWMDITLHFGLSPAIFYVPLSVDPGPPYGHAYGYYKKVPRAKWSTIRLPDADVVNLVNLRFMRDYYDADPGSVIRLRHEGKHFAAIGHAAGRKHGRSSPPGASHGKGKGKSSEKKPGRGHGRGHP